MEHVVTLVFSNADSASSKNIKILCDEDSIGHIMSWYRAYFAGDIYTVAVNGRNVPMDITGEPL